MSDSTTEITVSLGSLIEMETNLRKLESENKELRNPWISVDERLPETNDTVIIRVYYPNDENWTEISYDADWYDNGNWKIMPNKYVTHWQPIIPLEVKV